MIAAAADEDEEEEEEEEEEAEEARGVVVAVASGPYIPHALHGCCLAVQSRQNLPGKG